MFSLNSIRKSKCSNRFLPDIWLTIMKASHTIELYVSNMFETIFRCKIVRELYWTEVPQTQCLATYLWTRQEGKGDGIKLSLLYSTYLSFSFSLCWRNMFQTIFSPSLWETELIVSSNPLLYRKTATNVKRLHTH
jgi:hypothetical protein